MTRLGGLNSRSRFLQSLANKRRLKSDVKSASFKSVFIIGRAACLRLNSVWFYFCNKIAECTRLTLVVPAAMFVFLLRQEVGMRHWEDKHCSWESHLTRNRKGLRRISIAEVRVLVGRRWGWGQPSSVLASRASRDFHVFERKTWSPRPWRFPGEVRCKQREFHKKISPIHWFIGRGVGVQLCHLSRHVPISLKNACTCFRACCLWRAGCRDFLWLWEIVWSASERALALVGFKFS